MDKDTKLKARLVALVFVFALGAGSLFATSLRLRNDTKNIMKAEVHAADGTLIGATDVLPFETEVWDYDVAMRGKPKLQKSITPLTVVWKTEKGDFFSACTGVSSGAMITPVQCRSKT